MRPLATAAASWRSLLTAVAWLGRSAGADLGVTIGFFLSFWMMIVAALGCLAHVTRDEDGQGQEHDFRPARARRQGSLRGRAGLGAHRLSGAVSGPPGASLNGEGLARPLRAQGLARPPVALQTAPWPSRPRISTGPLFSDRASRENLENNQGKIDGPH